MQWKVPAWSPDINKWEDQPRIEVTVESESEAKLIKKILAITTANNGVYENFLNKHVLENFESISLDK